MELKTERAKKLFQSNITVRNLMEENIPLKMAEKIVQLFPQEFTDLKTDLEGGFFIYGPSGTGKTLYAIASVIYSQECSLFRLTFVNTGELLYRIRQTYSPNYKSDFVPSTDYGTEEDYILKTYQNAPILILDDLGIEKSSDWALQTLYLLVNYRYENLLPTITTTNYSPKELTEKMGDFRIISRLCDMGEVIEAKKQLRH